MNATRAPRKRTRATRRKVAPKTECSTGTMAESRDGRKQEAHGGAVSCQSLNRRLLRAFRFLGCCFPPEEIVEHLEEFAAYCREMEGHRWIR